MAERPLLDTSIITMQVEISEEALRDRLAHELMRSLGLMTENDKPKPGVTFNVLRGEGRKGGYRVQVTRDMTKDTTPRLGAPEVRHG